MRRGAAQQFASWERLLERLNGKRNGDIRLAFSTQDAGSAGSWSKSPGGTGHMLGSIPTAFVGEIRRSMAFRHARMPHVERRALAPH